MRPIAPSCKGKSGLRRNFSQRRYADCTRAPRESQRLLLLEKLFEQVARLDALLTVAAAEQALERLLDLLGLEVLADLLSRLR